MKTNGDSQGTLYPSPRRKERPGGGNGFGNVSFSKLAKVAKPTTVAYGYSILPDSWIPWNSS